MSQQANRRILAPRRASGFAPQGQNETQPPSPVAVSERHVLKSQWKTLLLWSSALLAMLSLFNILADLGLHGGWPTLITALFVFWAGLFLLATYKYFGTVYLFATAYVISLAVFHLGHIAAHAVGWFNVGYLFAGDMAPWFQRAGWYNLLAFGCFGIGVALALKNARLQIDSGSVNQSDVDANLEAAYWIGVALLLASLVAAALLIGSMGNILRFSRAEIFGGVGDTRGFGFFLLVAPSAIVLLVIGANTRGQKRFAYTTGALTLLVVLFLGYRSSALFPMLIGAIIWTKLGRKIPISLAVTATVIVLIAIPTISTLRSLGPYQEISVDDFKHSVKEADVEDVVQQLGGVSVVVAHVLKWVPAEDPYRFGQSYLLALRNAIPNIGFSIGETDRAKIADKGFLDNEAIRKLNPGDWFTYRTSQYMFHIGGGSGFSTIAEAYLNFGLPGVIAFFLGLGYAFGKLEQVDLRTNPKTLIFSGAMLWPLLKSVRNAFGVFLKPVVFILASILIWKLITFWRSRRR